jgi:predicted nucleotidyltransferase
MRVDPKGTIAGHPAVVVRNALRRLRVHVEWNLERLEVAARLPAGQGRRFVDALIADGLVEVTGKGTWSITQPGQTLSSATAAPRVKRATAEKALQEVLGRVDSVNKRSYYLGQVVAVVLFGSMLKPEVDRVSDVDLAVEIVPKEADPERTRRKSYQRAGELQRMGRRLRGLLGRELCWYWEVFDFLKGQSRVISLVDLKHEGAFVLGVPHKTLYADGKWSADAPPRAVPTRRCFRLPVDDDLF